MAYIFLINPLITFRLEYGLFDKNINYDKQYIIGSSVTISIISFTLYSIIYLFLSLAEFNYFFDKLDFSFTYLIVGAFLYGNYQILNCYYISNGDFMKSGFLKLIDILSFFILVSLDFSQNIILIRVYSFFVIVAIGLFFKPKISFKNFDSVLSKFKNKMVVLTPSHFLNAFNREGVLVIINFIFGPSITGYFYFIQKIVKVPLIFLGNSLGEVIRFRFDIDKKQFIKYLIVMAIVSLFFNLIIVNSIELIFKYILEINYNDYRPFLMPLIIVAFFQFLSNPLGNLFLTKGKQNLDFLWQIINLILSSLAMLYGYLTGSLFHFLIIYAVMSSTSYIINMFLVRRYII